MRKIYKNKPVELFVTDDGREFENKEDALEHERKLNELQKVFVVFKTNGDSKEFVGICSTAKIAQQVIEDEVKAKGHGVDNRYKYEPVFVDELVKKK